MAFVVEDGTGLANANAYVAIAYVDTYHLDRENTGWTGGDSVKQKAIILATDYVDARFGQKFRGVKKTKDQALEWPRYDAYDDDGYAFDGDDAVPRLLQRAIAEYSLRALALGILLPDPILPFSTRDTLNAGSTQSEAQAGEVVRKMEKVGPIVELTEYKSAEQTVITLSSRGNGQVPGAMIPAYPKADLLIAELLRSSTSHQLFRG